MGLYPIFNERGTGDFVLTFTDEDDDAVTPNEITWHLTDLSGQTVINDLEDQTITPAASVRVQLEGADLQVLSAEVKKQYAKRLLTVEITYDSAQGSDRPEKEEQEFWVKNLKYISS